MTIKCVICNKDFYIKPYRESQAKYCSRSCQFKGQLGKPTWNKGKKTGLIPRTAFKKGEHVSRATEFKKGDRPHNYKGEDVGYYSLHNWVSRHKGKAIKCQKCTSEKNVQWANKSHEYKRDLSDWLELCYTCHRKYDRENGWGKATRKYPQLSRR